MLKVAIRIGMAELSHWEDVVVPQRHDTGCVPTGYEWIIRYLGIESVNLETFQEDFDLGKSNNFVSVADEVKSRYSHVNIETCNFDQGIEKIRAIRRLIERDIPCLISLALADIQGTGVHTKIIHMGWHIMPIVCIDDQKIKMIHHADEKGNHTWEFPIQEAIWRHNNLKGGKDIAWIEA